MNAAKLADNPLGRARRLLSQIHEDEGGAVSVESMLIIAAIALPILIFIIKVGWPRIKDYFNRGMDDLEGAAGAGAAP